MGGVGEKPYLYRIVVLGEYLQRKMTPPASLGDASDLTESTVFIFHTSDRYVREFAYRNVVVIVLEIGREFCGQIHIETEEVYLV